MESYMRSGSSDSRNRNEGILPTLATSANGSNRCSSSPDCHGEADGRSTPSSSPPATHSEGSISATHSDNSMDAALMRAFRPAGFPSYYPFTGVGASPLGITNPFPILPGGLTARANQQTLANALLGVPQLHSITPEMWENFKLLSYLWATTPNVPGTSVATASASLSPGGLPNTLKCSSASKVLGKSRRVVVAGDQLFTCEFCEYQTLRLHHLKRHKMTHTGEKPFKCSECNFSCARSDSLELHRRTHAVRNPLACMHCIYVAETEKASTEHRKNVHKFECQKCGQIFPTLRMLRWHERGHRLVVCRFCQFSSMYMKRVERHEKSIHSDQFKFAKYCPDFLEHSSETTGDQRTSLDDTPSEQPVTENVPEQEISSTRMTTSSTLNIIDPGIIDYSQKDHISKEPSPSFPSFSLFTQDENQAPSNSRPVSGLADIAGGAHGVKFDYAASSLYSDFSAQVKQSPVLPFSLPDGTSILPV